MFVFNLGIVVNPIPASRGVSELEMSPCQCLNFFSRKWIHCIISCILKGYIFCITFPLILIFTVTSIYSNISTLTESSTPKTCRSIHLHTPYFRNQYVHWILLPTHWHGSRRSNTSMIYLPLNIGTLLLSVSVWCLNLKYWFGLKSPNFGGGVKIDNIHQFILGGDVSRVVLSRGQVLLS